MLNADVIDSLQPGRRGYEDHCAAKLRKAPDYAPGTLDNCAHPTLPALGAICAPAFSPYIIERSADIFVRSFKFERAGFSSPRSFSLARLASREPWRSARSRDAKLEEAILNKPDLRGARQ